jgi:hypothetical protein
VKIQLWTAISAYVLVATAKKPLKPDQSLYTILQILKILRRRPFRENTHSAPIHSCEIRKMGEGSGCPVKYVYATKRWDSSDFWYLFIAVQDNSKHHPSSR